MERSDCNMEEEEENQQSSKADHVVVQKRMESPIKINSIYIELGAPKEDNSTAEKCHHFSIRGYVSEVREKDISKCWPFDSPVQANTADCEDDHRQVLPPLDERLFRYWRCEYCSQKIGPVKNIQHSAVLLKPCSSGKRTSSSPLPTTVVAAPMLMLKQKPSGLDDVEGLSKDDLLSTTDKSENKLTNAPGTSISGETVRLKHHLNGDTVVTEICPSNMRINSSKCLDLFTFGLCILAVDYVVIAVKLVFFVIGSINLFDSLKAGCVDHEVAADDPSRNLDSMVIKDSVETFETGKGNSRHDKHTSLTVRLKYVASGHVSDSCTRGKGDNASAQDTMEAGYGSSEDAEKTGVKNDHDPQSSHRDHSSGPRRRKTRKIRLLTDLLCEKGVHESADSLKAADSLPSLNVVPYAPAEVDDKPPGSPDDQVEIEGIGSAKRTLIPYKKRKFPRDDQWSTPESNPSSSKVSRARILKKAVDHIPKKKKALTSDSVVDVQDKMVIESSIKGNSSKVRGTNSAIMSKKVSNKEASFNSALVADVRNKVVQQSSTKSNSSKSRVENSGAVGKQKDKSVVVPDDDSLSLAPPSRESFPTVTEISIGDNACGVADATGHAAPKPVENLNAGREIDLFPLRAQYVDGKSSSVKNKQGKPGLFGENLSMLREGLVVRESESTMQTRPVHDQANQDFSSERGLNLSLDIYTARHQPERTYNSVHDRQSFLFGEHIRMTSNEQVTRKDEQTQYVGMFSSSHGSPMHPPFGGIQSDVRRKQPMHSFLGAAHNYSSQVEMGGFHMQRKDVASTSSNEKSIGIQAHASGKRRDIDLRAGSRASEAPASDDIPMEIVELMAKNQYERCLPDAQADSSRGHQTLDFGNRHVVDTHRFYHEALREKLLAQNGRNGMIQWSENSRPPAKQKSVAQLPDQSQFFINQAEQSCPPPLGYAEFLQRQYPSGTPQNAASSTGRQIGGQHLQWLRNLSTKGPPVQSSSHHTTGSWSEEANHSRRTMAPSHNLPFMFNDPKLLNQNATSFRRQGSNSYGSETPRRGSHLENPPARRSNTNMIELNQKPAGNADIYSNETISAMHLLSLMDAGLGSNGQVNQESPSTTRDGHHSVMRTLPYDHGSENKFTRGFQQHGPANSQRIGSSASFQLDSRGFKKAIDFSSQVSQETRRRQEDMDSLAENRRGGIPQLSGSSPVHIRKKILGSSDSSSRLPFQMQEASKFSSSIEYRLEAGSKTNTTGHPQKHTLELQETCRINRNPADFSYPGPGNPYMIGPKDLKFLDADGGEQKRQKKLAAIRGRGKHHLNP
ncbi:unnamed protein product [Linum tenue]|uniref:Protein EMBRYONIC FLOWER 1-like n=1 Tax=Linum tenue TaxID=586396 RepID=A0AAV0M7A7_9ROSI|nr:unnamed protein product [Linum tenue]